MKNLLMICLIPIIHSSFQVNKDIIGTWYSPNALILIEFNENGACTSHSIDNDLDSHKWKLEGERIILEYSTEFILEDNTLSLLGHKLSKEKPKTATPESIKLSGLRFYRTFEFEGLKTDTLSFNDSTCFSSFNERYFNYELTEWQGMVYYTDDVLSNLRDEYTLIEVFDENRMKFNHYDNHLKEHHHITWNRVK